MSRAFYILENRSIDGWMSRFFWLSDNGNPHDDRKLLWKSYLIFINLFNLGYQTNQKSDNNATLLRENKMFIWSCLMKINITKKEYVKLLDFSYIVDWIMHVFDMRTGQKLKSTGT
jgi:hypothetical protein